MLDAHSCDSPCDETSVVVVELFEYKSKYRAFKKKVQILSMKISLQDEEIYTEKVYQSE